MLICIKGSMQLFVYSEHIHYYSTEWVWEHGFYHSVTDITGNKLNAPHYCWHSYLTSDHRYAWGNFQSVPGMWQKARRRKQFHNNSKIRRIMSGGTWRSSFTSLHVDAFISVDFFFGGTWAACLQKERKKKKIEHMSFPDSYIPIFIYFYLFMTMPY